MQRALDAGRAIHCDITSIRACSHREVNDASEITEPKSRTDSKQARYRLCCERCDVQMMADVPQGASLPVDLVCKLKGEIDVRLVMFEEHRGQVSETNGRKTAPL